MTDPSNARELEARGANFVEGLENCACNIDQERRERDYGRVIGAERSKWTVCADRRIES